MGNSDVAADVEGRVREIDRVVVVRVADADVTIFRKVIPGDIVPGLVTVIGDGSVVIYAGPVALAVGRVVDVDLG